jgi:hypothetical protein
VKKLCIKIINIYMLYIIKTTYFDIVTNEYSCNILFDSHLDIMLGQSSISGIELQLYSVVASKKPHQIINVCYNFFVFASDIVFVLHFYVINRIWVSVHSIAFQKNEKKNIKMIIGEL